MRLSEEINRKAAPREIVRYGLVSSVGAGTLTVTTSGESIPNLPWLDSYTPTPGDRVAILRSNAGWLVLGKVTFEGAVYNEPVTIEVQPDAWWAARRTLSTESWDGHYDESGNPVLVPEPEVLFPDADWEAIEAEPFSTTIWDRSAEHFAAALGRFRAAQGDGSKVNYRAPQRELWYALHYPSIEDLLPAGAVVTDISFPVRNDGVGIHPPIQGDPTITVHGIDMADDEAIPLRDHVLPPFDFVSGYTDWKAGRVDPARVGSFKLPSNWREALLDGTLTGLAFYEPGTGMYVSEAREFLDSAPWSRPITNVKPFVLRVTYVTVAEEL